MAVQLQLCFVVKVSGMHHMVLLLLLLLLLQVESTVVEQLGVARKVTISGTATTLIADSASKDEIEMRVAQVCGWWAVLGSNAALHEPKDVNTCAALATAPNGALHRLAGVHCLCNMLHC
jgi:hypothetical protein